MNDTRPTWMLVLEAARLLDAGTGVDFSMQDLLREVQRLDEKRQRGSIQPVVQGMTRNAGAGPPSAAGKVLERVRHGSYRLVEEPQGPVVPTKPARPTKRRGRPRIVSVQELEGRVAELVANFEHYVGVYDESTPFGRAGQFELHRQTIDRRRSLGSAVEALRDEQFISLLHGTLQAWGIGRRASRLAPLDAFAECLLDRSEDIGRLDGLSLEEAGTDVMDVVEVVDRLISELPIVDNRARIVAGTKTLHHLVPDLLPPMDRAWTGAFFGWGVLDPQNHQREILEEAMSLLRSVALQVTPSRLVGDGWRTSSTKILDNGLIGFCKTVHIGG